MPAPFSDRHTFLDAARGPITAVAAFRATRRERARAYSSSEAGQIVRSMGLGLESERTALQALIAAFADEPFAPRDVPTAALVGRATAAVEAETLLLVPGWGWLHDSGGPPEGVDEPREIAAGAVHSDQKTFELVVVDASTGRPLAEVPLRILTPVGAEHLMVTDAAGRVRLTDLDPGTCAVTSLIDQARLGSAYAPVAGSVTARLGTGRSPRGPAHLVEVSPHRVRTGETPRSIAARHGVSWEAIALFNWGTSDPAALERHYRQTLGCRRRAPDGRTYRFDDRDEPGVLSIPRRWEGRYAVGGAHELRVAPLRTIFLSLENEAGLAVPGARYHARFGDGTERNGRLGASGIARLEGVPDEAFTVSYPDALDLLAGSLAASVRQALEQAITGPVWTLLMQSPEVVARATGIYQEHLDDLGGRGLAADLDEIVTDPEARRPLLALCARAGLRVEVVTSPLRAAS